MSGLRPLVVVPTYDERENLPHLVEAVTALPGAFHLLVVDDASPDGTGELAEEIASTNERVHVLHRAGKEGIGPAYVAGFQWGMEWGADVILQMDADLSHDPADLPRLLAALDEADVAIGSRYCGGVRVLDWSVKRLLLSLAASLYVRLVLGLPVQDPTGGFKAWRREVLEALQLDEARARGYSFQVETSYRAWRMGFRLVEVPIVFAERERGGSKITGGIVTEALHVLVRLRLSSLLERRRGPAAVLAEAADSEGPGAVEPAPPAR